MGKELRMDNGDVVDAFDWGDGFATASCPNCPARIAKVDESLWRCVQCGATRTEAEDTNE